MSDIHVSRAGKTFGPYATAQAEALYREGVLEPADLVWKDGLSDWVPAFELFKHLAPASGLPPPVPRPVETVPPVSATASALPVRAVATAALPLPPKLHWGLVLLFSVLTVGIFFIVWMFIQSSWVRKIDPTSNATIQLIGYVVLMVVGQILAEVPNEGLQGIGMLLLFASYVSFYFGIYSMRRSMLSRYADDDAVDFKLSRGMTFFFNVLYLQSRMTYIHQARGAADKRYPGAGQG